MRWGEPIARAAFLLASLSQPTFASVDEPAAADPASKTTVLIQTHPPKPGWPAGMAALVPGLVVHGSGLWVAGDRETASRLLTAEGIGLGMIGAGALPLMLTEASGQNLDISVALLVAGAGLFLTSGIADFYGAAVGGRDHARPPTRQPYLEPYVGYAYVHDPQFDYRHFTVLRLDARLGGFRVAPEAWLAMNGDNQRTGLEAAVRLVGPRPDGNAADGSFADFQAGAAYQRFGRDGFSILTSEFLFPMRLDLRRLSRSTAGSFVDLDLGWAFELFDYGIAGHGTDITGLLLLRFGYGLYFGCPKSPRGEMEIYYDHRHDGFAGGLAADIHDPNVFGHVGLAAKAAVRPGWALKLDLEMGSAAVAAFGVLYDWGGRR